MRLTTLVVDGRTRVGVLDTDVVRLLEPGPTLQDVIAGGAEALADAAPVEIPTGRRRIRP